jgi:excisionase family DNA binding protein
MERTPYLTVDEVAKLLRIHPQSVYKMVSDGEMPHIRSGRKIRIPRTALDQITRATRAS